MSVRKREYKHKGVSKPVWEYNFTYARKRYKQAGFVKRKDAEIAEAEAKKKVMLENQPLRPSKAMPFSKLLGTFLRDRETVVAPGTYERERKRAKPLLRRFGELKAHRINAADVRRYVRDRKQQGLANRSINLELTLLRSIFKYAIENRTAVQNPAKDVTNLKEVTDEHWIPTEAELVRFIDAASRTPSAPVLVPWTWFRVYTGTRPTESVYVEWQDIDFGKEQIRIRPKDGHDLKNARFRVVEMHPRLKQILLAWREQWQRVFAKRHERYPDEPSPPHDWVFFNPRNQDERARMFWKCFDQARNAAGLPLMTSHTLRHYFISRCVMDGIDYLTIMRWVGHSSVRMIETVYSHLKPDYRASQMRKLHIQDDDAEENPSATAG